MWNQAVFDDRLAMFAAERRNASALAAAGWLGLAAAPTLVPVLDRAPKERNETGAWLRRHDEQGKQSAMQDEADATHLTMRPSRRLVRAVVARLGDGGRHAHSAWLAAGRHRSSPGYDADGGLGR